MADNKSDRQKLLIDVAMKFLDQPPEKIEKMTNYIQAVAPQGIDQSLLKMFY